MVDFSKLLKNRRETDKFRQEHVATTIVSDEESVIRQFLGKDGPANMKRQIDQTLARSHADTLLVAADMPMLRYACETAKAMGMRTIAVEPSDATKAELSEERLSAMERNRGVADKTITLERGQNVNRYIAERVSSAACFTAGTQGVVDDFQDKLYSASLGREDADVTVTDVAMPAKDATGERGAEVTVAVTGHRPDKLYGYDTADPRYDMLRERLSAQFEELGATHLVTGMALGFDQLAFEVAKERGMKVTAAVPFQGQAGNWPKASQEQYQEMLSRADRAVVVSQGEYSPEKMQTRNEWMVDHADSVIACWDGSSGGTENCVRYAKSRHKDIDTIRPQEILAEYDQTRVAQGDKEMEKALAVIGDPQRNVASLVSAGPKQMFGYNPNDPGYKACKAWLADELDKCGADTLVVCADSGLPTIAAELALEKGMGLIIAEPNDGVGQKWPNAARSNLWRLRNAAIANPHISDGAYSPDKVRNAQAWVAKSADTCLAIGPDTKKMFRGPLHAAVIDPRCTVVATSTKDVLLAYQDQAETQAGARESQPEKTQETQNLRPLGQMLEGDAKLMDLSDALGE